MGLLGLVATFPRLLWDLVWPFRACHPCVPSLAIYSDFTLSIISIFGFFS